MQNIRRRHAHYGRHTLTKSIHDRECAWHEFVSAGPLVSFDSANFTRNFTETTAQERSWTDRILSRPSTRLLAHAATPAIAANPNDDEDAPRLKATATETASGVEVVVVLLLLSFALIVLFVLLDCRCFSANWVLNAYNEVTPTVGGR